MNSDKNVLNANPSENNEYKNRELEQDEDVKKRSVKSVLLEVLMYIVLFYVCIAVVPNYVIQRTVVDGPSMENTLVNGENLLVEKLSFRLDALKRFDIIVFYPYGHDVEEYFVKRIIGLPGETVQIIGSEIYINGEVLEEDYGKDPITYSGIAEEPITLGNEEYFVLGDNREISFDSRYEEIGIISKDNIGGRAILRIWPFNKFGLID
jgi:signal peptidase I